MDKFRYIILLLFLGSLQLADAQTISLSGYVTDEYDKKPISNVVVKMVGYNISTTTNNGGFFKIQYKDITDPKISF